VRYAGGMRYPNGGGLTADERAARQEPVRLTVVEWIERCQRPRCATASGCCGCRRTGEPVVAVAGRRRPAGAGAERPGPAGSRAQRGADRRVAAEDLARNNRAAADLGAWLVFQGESARASGRRRVVPEASGATLRWCGHQLQGEDVACGVDRRSWVRCHAAPFGRPTCRLWRRRWLDTFDA
jgi:hypothetical protein